MENKELIIDRIEGDFAVCELPDETEQLVALSLLPKGVKEGTVLELRDGAYVINEKKEKEARKANFDLQNQLFNRKRNR